MLDITALRELAADIRRVIISQHVLKRFGERHINIGDVIAVINCGEIIEQYPNDYPYPSCLIPGLDINGKNMHYTHCLRNKRRESLDYYRLLSVGG